MQSEPQTPVKGHSMPFLCSFAGSAPSRPECTAILRAFRTPHQHGNTIGACRSAQQHNRVQGRPFYIACASIPTLTSICSRPAHHQLQERMICAYSQPPAAIWYSVHSSLRMCSKRGDNQGAQKFASQRESIGCVMVMDTSSAGMH